MSTAVAKAAPYKMRTNVPIASAPRMRPAPSRASVAALDRAGGSGRAHTSAWRGWGGGSVVGSRSSPAIRIRRAIACTTRTSPTPSHTASLMPSKDRAEESPELARTRAFQIPLRMLRYRRMGRRPIAPRLRLSDHTNTTNAAPACVPRHGGAWLETPRAADPAFQRSSNAKPRLLPRRAVARRRLAWVVQFAGGAADKNVRLVTVDRSRVLAAVAAVVMVAAVVWTLTHRSGVSGL